MEGIERSEEKEVVTISRVGNKIVIEFDFPEEMRGELAHYLGAMKHLFHIAGMTDIRVEDDTTVPVNVSEVQK